MYHGASDKHPLQNEKIMKRVSLLPFALFALTMLTACGDDNLDKFDGAWRCDGKASLAIASPRPNSPELESTMSSVCLYVDSSKKLLTVSAPGQSDTLTFTVASDSGNVLEIAADETQGRIEFRDDDTILYSSQKQQKPLVFTRIK